MQTSSTETQQRFDSPDILCCNSSTGLPFPKNIWIARDLFLLLLEKVFLLGEIFHSRAWNICSRTWNTCFRTWNISFRAWNIKSPRREKLFSGFSIFFVWAVRICFLRFSPRSYQQKGTIINIFGRMPTQKDAFLRLLAYLCKIKMYPYPLWGQTGGIANGK